MMQMSRGPVAHSLIHSRNIYLAGTVLDTGEIAVNEIEKVSAFQRGETGGKQMNKLIKK